MSVVITRNTPTVYQFYASQNPSSTSKRLFPSPKMAILKMSSLSICLHSSGLMVAA